MVMSILARSGIRLLRFRNLDNSADERGASVADWSNVVVVGVWGGDFNDDTLSEIG